MYREYHVLLTTDLSRDNLPWKDCVSVEAENPTDAATKTLRKMWKSLVGDTFRRGGTIRAWVWLDKSPRYENGCPMCIHGLDLVRPPTEDSPRLCANAPDCMNHTKDHAEFCEACIGGGSPTEETNP